MSEEEVNKIIAEFMGCTFEIKKRAFHDEYIITEDTEYQLPEPYTQSLDALIPVWDKLKSGYLQITLMSCGHEAEFYKNNNQIRYIARAKHFNQSITKATAAATAKAIEELKTGLEKDKRIDQLELHREALRSSAEKTTKNLKSLLQEANHEITGLELGHAIDVEIFKGVIDKSNQIILEAESIIQEAAELFHAIKEGEYKVDSLTNQPCRLFLTNNQDYINKIKGE